MKKEKTKRIPWNKGKKWSKEVKDKISKSMTGQEAWNKGSKWSQETKNRISSSMKEHYKNNKK